VIDARRRIQQPQVHQFGAKRGRVSKEDAVHAESGGGIDVCFKVVDIDGVGRVDGVGGKEKSENARIGFEETDFAGEQDSLKPSQELESLQG